MKTSNVVRNLLIKGDVDRALLELDNPLFRINNDSLQDEILLLRNRLSRVKQSEIIGEDTNQEINKIIWDILQVTKKIEVIENNQDDLIIEDIENIISIISDRLDFTMNNNFAKIISVKKRLDDIVEHKLFLSLEINLGNNEIIRSLFQEIRLAEDLSSFHISTISNIRFRTTDYSWGVRSIIISGITVSCIKSYSKEKVNILLDFISDFEDSNWQKALVGITVILFIHTQKILEDRRVVMRLEEFRNIPKIQFGLTEIAEILKRKEFLRGLNEGIKGEILSSALAFTPFSHTDYIKSASMKHLSMVDDLLISLERSHKFLSVEKHILANKIIYEYTSEEIISLVDELDREFNAYSDMSIKMNENNSYSDYINTVQEIYMYILSIDNEHYLSSFKSVSNKSISEVNLNIFDDKMLTYAQANELYIDGQINEALKLYNEAIQKGVLSIKILNRIGRANYRLGNYKAAIEFYEKALTANDSYYLSNTTYKISVLLHKLLYAYESQQFDLAVDIIMMVEPALINNDYLNQIAAFTYSKLEQWSQSSFYFDKLFSNQNQRSKDLLIVASIVNQLAENYKKAIV